MKEALYYKKLKNKIVRCTLCPRDCVVKPKYRGNCGVRENKNGKLYSLVYGKPCSAAIDPIEKKPLFHFLPGHRSYSIGTAGCNLHCLFCQNWEISQCYPEDIPSLDLPPNKVVEEAVVNNCKSIAYTYTDPASTAAEYVIDTAKIARKKGIKNVIVSNGFINKKPLKDLCKYIDAANIDLKSFDDNFYRKVTGAWLKPILDSMITLKKNNVWLEITNLVIPGKNDDIYTIKKMCNWIKRNLGKDVPLHFSRFFPCYKMKDLYPTEPKTLENAKEIANKVGLKFVYVGNLITKDGENTYCPKCKKLLIERSSFSVLRNNLKEGRCECGEKIPGIWK